MPQWLPRRDDAPGLALAFLVGGAALALARALPESPFLSDILLALVAGAAIQSSPARRLLGLSAAGNERDPDRYAPGLRYVGKWVLRLAIVLMGLKVRTSFFGAAELELIGGVLVASLPSAFFVAQAAGAWARVRPPMVDLLAGGTMICGASAVNAIAPVVGARREEQGVAVAAVFLFSVVALLTFRPIAHAVGLDPAHAGLWSGLAVNDLSSAIAVGTQMGGDGGVFAAAAKSARVLMLAPTLIILAIVRAAGRTRPGAADGLRATALAALPGYLVGYVLLALCRAAADRLVPGPAWDAILLCDRWAVDLLLLAVAAGIGLHLHPATLLRSGARALLVGGATSLWMAALTLAMIAAAAGGSPATAALVGLGGTVTAVILARLAGGRAAALRLIEERLAQGLPLSLAEATQVLDARELAGGVDDDLRRRLLRQLHPSIGELIPVRESPLAHGDGSRWLTYWQGRSGWALVAVLREPGSYTPIHAHPHRLLARTIEGTVEELSFSEQAGQVELTGRRRLAHDELVETDGLESVHAVRTLGPRPAIDLQLRGPEVGRPGRRLRTAGDVDLARLDVGARIAVEVEIDDRPGHGGEGPGAGRPVSDPARA